MIRAETALLHDTRSVLRRPATTGAVARLVVTVMLLSHLGTSALAQTASPSSSEPAQPDETRILPSSSDTADDSLGNRAALEDEVEQLDAEANRLIEELERQRAELLSLRDTISVSDQRIVELGDDIAALEQDRADITEDLIETTSRMQALEGTIERAEVRLTTLQEDQHRVRLSLNQRRGTLAQLLSSLQRIGTTPPPALVVSPDDAVGAVRSAIILSALMPEVQKTVSALSSDLEELASIKADITSEREVLLADLQSQAENEVRLEILLRDKQNAVGAQQTALQQERARAQDLAANAISLEELIADLENEITVSQRASERARLAREAPPPSIDDFARLAPAIAFEEAKGLIPLPVRGVMVQQYGDLDRTGERTEGLTIATRSGARVVSPADGWVAYAGPFRSYGNVLILKASEDYHLLIAGMAQTYVSLGEFILSGEPVGEMGERRLASAAGVTLEPTQPTLYIEFRKDGVPVDPTPWWSPQNDTEESG